jgi:hypothetical protein
LALVFRRPRTNTHSSRKMHAARTKHSELLELATTTTRSSRSISSCCDDLGGPGTNVQTLCTVVSRLCECSQVDGWVAACCLRAWLVACFAGAVRAKCQATSPNCQNSREKKSRCFCASLHTQNNEIREIRCNCATAHILNVCASQRMSLSNCHNGRTKSRTQY